MRVSDVMTTEVVTTTRETTLRAAAAQLAAHHISGMPVVGADGQVVTGVLSASDVLAAQRRGSARGPRAGARLVGDVMSAPAVTVSSSASVAGAAGRMFDHDVNRLPVIEHGRLVGIVSRADLVRAFAQADDVP
jgi:CBS domain-containing protein